MAAVRQTKTGRWELTITNRLLPKGRAWFTFDSKADADAYGAQAEKWLAAGLVPPDLAVDTTRDRAALLGPLIRAWANSGAPSASEQAELDRLYAELAAVPLRDLTYTWCEAWVRSMKLQRNLAPSSIRKRVQALARAVDDHLRRTPDALAGNPLRLLPKGYSAYNPGDRAALAKLATAGQAVVVRTDQVRERRLSAGEEAAILRALAGDRRPDRERPGHHALPALRPRALAGGGVLRPATHRSDATPAAAQGGQRSAVIGHRARSATLRWASVRRLEDCLPLFAPKPQNWQCRSAADASAVTALVISPASTPRCNGCKDRPAGLSPVASPRR